MKKIIMSLALVAAMVVAVSCACNNNSGKAQECAATECSDCAGCDKACDKAEPCCDKEGCQQDQCCDKACDKQCDKACCDSTNVDCKKAE